MCGPPVRGDNPQALANGLSYVQVDSPWYNYFYQGISVDLAHHEIALAQVGKGGINSVHAILNDGLLIVNSPVHF